MGASVSFPHGPLELDHVGAGTAAATSVAGATLDGDAR